MGRPVLRFFDPSSPEWPENERRYLRNYLLTQVITQGIVWGAAAALLIVLAFAWMVKR